MGGMVFLFHPWTAVEGGVCLCVCDQIQIQTQRQRESPLFLHRTGLNQKIKILKRILCCFPRPAAALPPQ